MEVVGCVVNVVRGGFLGWDGGVELGGGDLFCGGLGEAELAGGEIVFGGAHGWAEGSAEDGASFVEVTGAGGGIEDGAGFVVAEGVFRFVYEELGVFVIWVEYAGVWVSGEVRGQACAGLACSGLDAVGFLRVGLFEGGEGFAEAFGVLLGDGEDADAALGAAGVAGEVLASAAVGVGYCGVYDLDEGLLHLDSVEGRTLRDAQLCDETA